ncbi:MAG: DsbA family protein [Pseudomonadales bacterium]
MRVYIDFKSPAAYLAIAPTLRLAAEHHLVLEWRAFNATVAALPEKVPDETKGQTHRRVRAAAQQRMHLLYAGIQGLPMHFRAQPGSTALALWVLEQLPASRRTPYVEACFTAYWLHQQDLNDPQVVAALLQACGEDAQLAHTALPDSALIELNEQAQLTDGVVDVPAYVAGTELFIGREHLPWLAELCQAGGVH